MRDDRTFIRLHDGMPDHPKVEALSDKAFRLLVERWCWCSRHRTDGRIPRAAWIKSGAAARNELVAAGLVEEHDDHVMMHDYLQHQRSAAEIEQLVQAKRRAGVVGNHNRWHGGKVDPDCPVCVAEGSHKVSHVPSQVGSHMRSQNVSQSDRKTSPETETETETETDKKKRSRRTSGGYSDEFERWWQAYPQRNGSRGAKLPAFKAWEKALKLTSVDALMAAAKRYTDSQRVRDGFAKDATTWLNQRCWEEFAVEAATTVEDWLKAEWRAGRVRLVEERTGLRYPQPDIPLDIAQDRVEEWLLGRCRKWIAANHDEIIRRLAGKESA